MVSTAGFAAGRRFFWHKLASSIYPFNGILTCPSYGAASSRGNAGWYLPSAHDAGLRSGWPECDLETPFPDPAMRDDVQCSLVDDSACLPIERRRAPRSRADIIGTIRLSGQHPEKCLIADLSTGGARIRRLFAGNLPQFLNIEIADGIIVPASIAWEEGNSFGVKFIHAVRSTRSSAACAIA